MTTYTITDAQRKRLMTALEPHKSTTLRWVTEEDAALGLLHSLQPNTQEPVLYQSRIRPAWKDDADWFAWETCSRESAEAYERTPLLHDWQYQVRRLYEHPAPKDSDEPRLSDLFCGVDVTEGMLSVSVLRRRSDDVAEVLHSEQFELPQAKPLTDEQIDKLQAKFSLHNTQERSAYGDAYLQTCNDKYGARNFARAIEQAHGVKP